MMQPPRHPRYDPVYDKACDFIVRQGITHLPADPFRLIKANQWGLVTYKDLAARVGKITVEDIADASQSKDGFTVFNAANYCIAYNSGIKVFARVVFTLFHEIGHIVLGHFRDFDVMHLSEREYGILEREANYFASSVMAPSVVIRGCGLTTVNSLRCASGMSCDAAETRLLQYQGWQPRSKDNEVLKAMQKYIGYNVRHHTEMCSIDIWCDEFRFSFK